MKAIKITDSKGIRVNMYRFTMTEAELNVMREEYEGLCVLCGSQQDGVEPDARNYKCENCGKIGVYGIEELILAGDWIDLE